MKGQLATIISLLILFNVLFKKILWSHFEKIGSKCTMAPRIKKPPYLVNTTIYGGTFQIIL